MLCPASCPLPPVPPVTVPSESTNSIPPTVVHLFSLGSVSVPLSTGGVTGGSTGVTGGSTGVTGLSISKTTG